MNVKDIWRHLPLSPATPKRRTKKPRGCIRSTQREKKDEIEKELEEQIKLDEDMHPEAGSTASEDVPMNNNVFYFAALAGKRKGNDVHGRDGRIVCNIPVWTPILHDRI